MRFVANPSFGRSALFLVIQLGLVSGRMKSPVWTRW